MPSTFTDSTLAAGWTQATLGDAIRQAFINAGYSAPIDDYTASNIRNLVFQVVAKAGVTFGTFFLRIQISSTFGITQTLQTAWNTGTKTATNPSASNTSITVTSSMAVQFKAINGGNEFKLVYLSQTGSGVATILGYIYPLTLNSVDENSFCAALQFSAVNSKVLQGVATQNPYANASYAILDFPNMQNANHFNRQDLFPRLQIFTASNRGLFGSTGDDLAVAASSGLSPLTPIGSYLLLQTSTNGVVVR